MNRRHLGQVWKFPRRPRVHGMSEFYGTVTTLNRSPRFTKRSTPVSISSTPLICTDRSRTKARGARHQGRRDDVVLATKFGNQRQPMVPSSGSTGHRSTCRSLRRRCAVSASR